MQSSAEDRHHLQASWPGLRMYEIYSAIVKNKPFDSVDGLLDFPMGSPIDQING
jgi:hypothetical protein